jgi:hypothetical protein
MQGQRLVDVQYRDMELGRCLTLSLVGPTTAYIEHPAPMPVGTCLDLITDEGMRIPSRVVQVCEQVVSAEVAPGMRIEVGVLDEKTHAWWASQVTGPDGWHRWIATERVSSAMTGATVLSSGVPLEALPADATQVMSAAEIQAIVGQATAIADDTGEFEAADSSTSGSHPSPTMPPGKHGKKKRRSKR